MMLQGMLIIVKVPTMTVTHNAAHSSLFLRSKASCFHVRGVLSNACISSFSAWPKWGSAKLV
jgi:hypothetical protein